MVFGLDGDTSALHALIRSWEHEPSPASSTTPPSTAPSTPPALRLMMGEAGNV